MSNPAEQILDVREMPPWQRHPRIFEVLDLLEPQQTLRLVNDHDPKPLGYQLAAERPEQFVWESFQEAERTWVALITRK